MTTYVRFSVSSDGYCRWILDSRTTLYSDKSSPRSEVRENTRQIHVQRGPREASHDALRRCDTRKHTANSLQMIVTFSNVIPRKETSDNETGRSFAFPGEMGHFQSPSFISTPADLLAREYKLHQAVPPSQTSLNSPTRTATATHQCS